MLTNKLLLSRLDKLLSDFLKTYAVKRLSRFEAAHQVDELKKITFGEKKQLRYLNNRFKALENWFIETGPRLKKTAFTQHLNKTVMDCVNRIGSYCSGGVDEDNRQSSIFDRKQAARVASMANVFLKESCRYTGYDYSPYGLKLCKPLDNPASPSMKKKSVENDIKINYKESLEYQLELIEYFLDTNDHLFTVVDNLLNKLENKPDKKTSHLVGSILYYMKINNYKVAPYVQRLRNINRQSS